MNPEPAEGELQPWVKQRLSVNLPHEQLLSRAEMEEHMSIQSAEPKRRHKPLRKWEDPFTEYCRACSATRSVWGGKPRGKWAYPDDSPAPSCTGRTF